MKIIKNGRHIVAGCEVQVEDGYIAGGRVTCYDKKGRAYYGAIYRAVSQQYGGGWDRTYDITPAAFRAGLARGTLEVFFSR